MVTSSERTPSASSAPLTHIRLLPPEVSGNEVRFQWTATPATELHRRSSFVLRFPAEIELGRVPEGLLWRVALISQHSLWILLQPCRIEIPIGLSPTEEEVWRHLIQSEWDTLNAYRQSPLEGPAVEMVANGRLSDCEMSVQSSRCVTAFSGGKDSLVQTGLLIELTSHPVAVSVTSPMPLLDDHLTERRRQVLNTVAGMPDVQFVEVESDYRSNIDHSFATRLGYPTSVNEMTDAFLYLGCLVIAGAALGAGHLFLASELEVQENAIVGDRIIQHPHFMYSVATQRALSLLLEKWGLRYSSLISPLYSYQSQTLLVTRYPDLWRLQYSCWRVRMGEAACNACPQCLRVAFGILSAGQRPGTVGLNLGRILRTLRKWIPSRAPDSGSRALPRDIVTARLHTQILRSVLAVEPGDVYREIKRHPSKRLPPAGMLLAWFSFMRLRRMARRCAPGPSPGYNADFLGFVDPMLRDQVSRIFASHFTSQKTEASFAIFDRAVRLSDWITEPIRNASQIPSEEA
jgi:hypothetical protein